MSLFLKKYYLIFLLVIVCFSFLIRVFDLKTNPPGFFCDEAAIGYNAFKILTTGADEYGVPFPFFFRSFGDYRLPIPIYANVPFSAIFGMTEVSVRLTTITFGLISIIFLILLGKELINETVGLLTGFFAAILPWHIQMSRWGSEYIYFPAIFSIAFFLYLKSLKNPKYFPFSTFFLALTMYTYYPSLIIVPIFTFFAFILFFTNVKYSQKLKITLIGFFVFFVSCIPLFISYGNGTLLTRWNSVNQADLSLQKRVIQFSQFYVQNFSPDFLFLKGDSAMPGHFVSRHSVLGFGELYLFQLPLILLGIFYALYKKRSVGIALMFLLLFLFPIGSAITSDGALATRSVIGIIPFVFFSALGLDLIFEVKKLNLRLINYIGVIVFVIFIVSMEISTFKYFNALYNSYPKYSADFWGWQFGARDIVQYFVSKEKNYDDEIMDPEFNSPDIFFKFYAPNDCNKCKLGLPDKMYDPNRKQLFALTPDYLQKNKQWNFLPLEKIYYPNGTIAFLVGEIVQ